MANDKSSIDNFDPLWLNARLDNIGRGADKVIPLLQSIQKQYNYLPQPALKHLCDNSEITPADITGVSTFYSQFRHTPAGRHNINVCVGTACHVKGADLVYEGFHRYLGCAENEDTDSQRQFTINKVACLGCCTLAPVVQIDDIIYGHVTAASAPNIIKNFLARLDNRQSDDKKGANDKILSSANEIRISLGSCCTASGSKAVWDEAQKVIDRYKLPVKIKRTGCISMCHQTPLMAVVVNGTPHHYARINADDVPGIILTHFHPLGIIDKAACRIDAWMESLLLSEDRDTAVNRRRIDMNDENLSSFFGRQKHIAMERCGAAGPLDIDEYMETGGFDALKKCLDGKTPDNIIDIIKEAGLRGRGGAGFPSGLKWQAVRDHSAGKRGDIYLICNGDEGDPGAFMDRMLFESFPFRIIEGMLIAAYAVGANGRISSSNTTDGREQPSPQSVNPSLTKTIEGIFYIRTEYPASIKTMREAIDICERRNLLGDKILGADFSVKFTIVEGAGAFVCGEETALIQSIEGKRGMPTPKPPYPAASGLYGRPTLINNCETLACVPWIIRNGAAEFKSTGTAKSPGTKVFALAGKIARGGLIETPMGVTVRDIVNHIGGGIAGGRKFKAVQIGGPSGGCIPAGLCDTPVDFERLTEAGAMMGSGGMVVLDERDCMVDVAKYFLTFTHDNSCGRCTFCRVGTKRMLDILENICAGKGTAKDLVILEELAASVKSASLCGLGKTAPNPVLTTLKYFRDEYEAHIHGRCPAGKCKNLISYQVTDKCCGCTICHQRCPVNAIMFTPHIRHNIDDTLCTRCDACRAACPKDAVRIICKNQEAAA
ncbi:MAG: NAD(P)H-dependent oxidoreductase subunit E [Chitinispirillia bacterium]|nr:NAD(P)H-dependent oxidoreductase subunit E [Chitinispirillia bacterium]MCL2269107.1 NAD(P)H-dependent oxidoreductase subunit E [Chitinispirillia bacterium]